MSDLNLKEKIEEWFSNLPIFRNSAMKRVNAVDKNRLDNIHKGFIDKLNNVLKAKCPEKDCGWNDALSYVKDELKELTGETK